jgi:hypothetical protein
MAVAEGGRKALRVQAAPCVGRDLLLLIDQLDDLVFDANRIR